MSEEIEVVELCIEGRRRDGGAWGYAIAFPESEIDKARAALVEWRRSENENFGDRREYRLVRVTVKTVTEVIDGEGVIVNG